MAPTRKRLLAVGAAASVISVAISVAVSLLTDGSLGWQSSSIFLLALAAFLFVSRSIRTGSGMPGFASPQEIYIETVAREASQRGRTEHIPSTYEMVWLWAALPPLIALVAIFVAG